MKIIYHLLLIILWCIFKNFS